MKLLAIRFSALGDVAMTVPVIDAVARRYPEVEITLLSRPFVQPLLVEMPSNVHFRGVDLKRYSGIKGLYRLFCELKAEGYDAVADLHDVLRTQLLRTLFALHGKRVASIRKGRSEKRALIRKGYLHSHPLPTSFQRYADVFARLGWGVEEFPFRSIYGQGRGDVCQFATLKLPAHSGRWIGLAPFAAHAGKILPAETIRQLIPLLLSSETPTELFLFGGGEKEIQLLEAWAAPYPHVHCVAGRMKLAGELALMSHLDVMVSMDSGNMHLASLVGTRVVSVWGATHPYAGFMGWRQSESCAVQADLDCRPCSIFGNKPCRRGDYACLRALTAEAIVRKVEETLQTPQP